jgi:adenine-specific DNA-methyltransferase
MPANNDLKKSIQTALISFEVQPLAEAARGLLNTLGYQSARTLKITPNTAQGFQNMFGRDKPLKDEARLEDWLSVDLLFQVTEAEIQGSLKGQGNFVATKVDNTDIHSYLFFAVELKNKSYTRTQLSGITRAINRLFESIPALIIFKYGGLLSMGIIARRLSKKDDFTDVLEKVTIIKDISFASPHRAHIEILHDLSICELHSRIGFSNFAELQKAWEKVLDTSALNKKFFLEVADWYFWAVDKVKFPSPPAPLPGGEGRHAEASKEMSVIRLITRLIFVWFIKEKGLVPPELFDERRLKELLYFNDPQKSSFYKAILQNLFFATLNTEMGAGRKFRIRNINPNGLDGNHGVTTLYRYEQQFKAPQEALKLFANIPFLNGGLFECLDKSEEKIYIDGFSDTPKNQPSVPDELFFGPEHPVDLSAAYGDTRRSREKVRGLIHIFNDYKFTIEENTPIEEEIALDPELLGKVFENLLAAYNPETGATARKQTGSFYTPREIVNYMVDEALIAYLENALTPTTLPEEVGQRLREKLRHLFAYNNQDPLFNETEILKLIEAINNLKALDPACGSGAFPMGLLHKLVFILKKLDPDNTRWREFQISKVADFPELVTQVEDAFKNNHDDYGRKLYLIQNCIYGVDIQPIAVQIAKLRVFISLVVEQKVDDSKPNRGIQPLPNLETKFIAANTLIGLQKPEAGKETAMSFGDLLYQGKRDELTEVRKRYFSARTPATKAKYREQDKKLRDELAELLKKDGWGSEAAQQLAGWDPYNQNAHADFFDPEWMFGFEEGFDVVIGNPPYVGERGHKNIFREISQNYWGKRYYQRKMDLFYFFFHFGLDHTKENGQICFISTNYFVTADGATKLRKAFRDQSTVRKIINFNEFKIFESALGQHNLISLLSKGKHNASTSVLTCNTKYQGVATSLELESILNWVDNQTEYHEFPQSELFEGENCYIRLSGQSNYSFDPVQSILNKIKIQGQDLETLCNISQGVLTGVDKITHKHIVEGLVDKKYLGHGVYILEENEVSELNLLPNEKKLVKPFFKNSDIEKFISKTKPQKYVVYVTRDLDIKNFPNINQHLMKFEKAIRARSMDRGEMQAALRLGKWWVIFAARNLDVFSGKKIICPQRSYKNTFAYNETLWLGSADVYFISEKDKSIDLKYILCLLNSKLYYLWLYHKGKRKGEMLELFYTPLTEIPIKHISLPNQKQFIQLSDQILAAKRANPAADTLVLEAEIDRLVYNLYGLTESEIKVVERRYN